MVEQAIRRTVNPIRAVIYQGVGPVSRLLKNNQINFVYDSRTNDDTNTPSNQQPQQSIQAGVKTSSGFNVGIVDKNANKRLAAKLLSEHKFYNAG